MVIDDYAYNNKLSKVNPNKKFALRTINNKH